MRLIVAFLLFFLFGIDFVCASESWKPSSTDPYNVEDPRYQALASYRKALVLIRVYSYIADRQLEPGDEADYLLADFQEQVAAAGIINALEYLKDYPDDTVAIKLLQFQVDRTAGVWPPWKGLALALFDRCRTAFDNTFETLSSEKQGKLIEDLEWAFRMSEADGPLIYSINDKKRRALQADIQKLKENYNRSTGSDIKDKKQHKKQRK
jgi:hypothetical protein